MADHRRSSRIVRHLAFVPKEMREASRQPRLILTLVLGPFLILFVFGLGYRPTPDALDALLVTAPGSGFATALPRIQEAVGPGLDLELAPGMDDAFRRLDEGSTDLIVIAPPDAAESIRAGEHAVIRVVHKHLDPFDAAYIQVLAQTATSELNQVILEEGARRVQEGAGEGDDPLPAARESASSLVDALERGDEPEAEVHRRALGLQLALLAGGAASSLDLVDGVATGVGGEQEGERLEALDRAREANSRLDPDSPAAVEDAREIERSLAELEGASAELDRIDPEVLVEPFRSETVTLGAVEVDLETFYVPGVIAVLLQHIAVTFAALSLVRDRRMGIVEVFRVSPLSPGEMLVGKYLAYTVYGMLVAAGLTALSIWVLGVPMVGDWRMLAGVVALTLLASLALGFLLSAVARTDTQAVQYTMIVLLVAIFFSGFVISLERLHPAAIVVSGLVPATMGIRGMQDIMFSGEPPGVAAIALLAGYIALAGMAGWWLVRRQMHVGE